MIFLLLCRSTKAYAEPPEPDGWDMSTVYAGDWAYRSGDFLCYTINDRVNIVGYYGHEENLVIPNEIDGRIVEGICGLKRLSPVKTITVGKNFGDLYVEGKVNLSVFYSIDELEEIRVAEENKNFTSKKGILYSKDMKVLYCVPPSIKQVSYAIPQMVTKIDYNDPFRNNKTLKEIKFGENTSIKGITGLFHNLENLETVDLTGITDIINECFYDCHRLKNIIFDNRLKRIDTSFYFLDTLQNVNLPENLRTMNDEGSFVQCQLIEKVKIPDKVSYISYNSFYKDNGKVDIITPAYIKTNVQQGDMNSYYACLALGGKVCNVQGLKSIKVSSPKGNLTVGEKRKIRLRGKCKEFIVVDEFEYTGNTIKGTVSKGSIKSGLFSFKSDHPEIVNVSKSGELIAISSGTATITIKCIPKPKIKCSVTVIVHDKK